MIEPLSAAGLSDATAPATKDRAEARRQQILDAACDCVRRAGFHGASVAEIAQAAGLSVGQIYRYFENKEAIIAAIVAQDLAEMREKFAEFKSAGASVGDTVLAGCGEAIARNYDPDRCALVLEVLAEAARNPSVAAVVRKADEAERALGRQLLEQIHGDRLSEAEMAGRGEVISMLFDGMVVRGLNHPDGDRVAITEAVRAVLRLLLLQPDLSAAPQAPKA